MGTAVLPGLTTEPESTISVTSSAAETMAVSYDLEIRSGQYVCTTGFAEGEVLSVNVSFAFTNGGDSVLSQQIVAAINYVGSAVGDCIQIGGQNEQCNHLFAWPSSFNNDVSGSYSASIDVSSAGYTFPNGDYQVCFGNGDQSDSESYSTFVGTASLPGLISV